MPNSYSNTRIEFHILQSFPVTCLNRDDVGAPKTAVVGGVTRARVSSQCWKRQVRLALPEFGIKLGTRTKYAATLFTSACRDAGANEAQAQACGEKMADLLAGKGKSKKEKPKQVKDDTLLFISESEAKAFAQYALEQEFDESKFKDKELAKIAQNSINPAIDALDIALFGRMLASAADMNVQAASSFAHAISTHKVSNEVEFFTALDDLSELQSEPGAAHMGSLEFNSATYYRYISLDLGQLAQSMDGDDLKKAIGAFTQALFVAVPNARQTTQSGASPWEFARVMVRKGQRLQAPFETAIRPKDGGFLQPSIDALKAYLDKKEKLSGSLFGKVASYDWGEDENFNMDHLITALQSHVQRAAP